MNAHKTAPFPWKTAFPKVQLHASSLVISMLTAVFAVQTHSSESKPTPAQKPNIVIILADDLGWGELGCYGQEKIRTPNLDRMAAAGMRFPQFYSGAPVCAPARNVLLTGLHSGHASIRGNRELKDEQGRPLEGQQPMPAESFTIAKALKQAGYATAAIGKWGLGPPGSSGDPNMHGFDLFFGYNCQRVAHSYYPPYLWRNQEKIIINANPIPGHKKQPDGPVRLEDYQSDKFAPDLLISEAVDFIEKHSKEPFFLYYAPIEPHVALQPPKRLVESYPESWDPIPYRGQCGYLPHPRPRAAYAAMITHLDEQVGKILQALKKAGVEDKTLVLFTSDNGTTHRSPQDTVFGVGGVDANFFNSTRGLRGFKGSVYEGGIRVPLIVQWPGNVPAGKTSDFPGYFPDIFATVADVLRLETPRKLDGISLLPLLTGQTAQLQRPPMVWVFPEYGGQVAVRFERFKVVRQNLSRRNPGPWEVYDVANDPSETNDLAQQQPAWIDKAIQILKREMAPNPIFPLVVPGVNDTGQNNKRPQ